MTPGGGGTFVGWLRRSALPLWAEAGFDPRAERFQERLDFGGRPIATPQRAMVQARQIYVFAHAAKLGWYEGERHAAAALRALRRDFGEESRTAASFAFAIAPNGSITSPVRDAYTHAFILMALAWMHELDGDKEHLDLADKVLGFLDREMHDARHGGLFDHAGAPSDAPKRQNPLMHLFEACLFLAETAPGRGYEERTDALGLLFEHRILRSDQSCFPELFSADWSDHPDPESACLYEPGHLLEWAWLLDRHRRLGGRNRATLGHALANKAFASIDNPHGLIPDAVDIRTGAAAPRFRLWPHTEALKVASLQRREGITSVDALAGVVGQRFLAGPFEGGWIDRCGADGRALVDHVPASSLYHLMLAGTEVAAVASERRLIDVLPVAPTRRIV